MKDYFNYQGDFSKLSRMDLEYLLLELNRYRIRYRKELGIEETASFGLELEFEDVLLYYVKKEFSKHKEFRYWSVHEDKSCSYQIDDFLVGGEVASDILHDEEADWKIVSEAVMLLQKMHAHATDKTSLHVHVGTQIFGEDIQNVVKFVKVWCIFEHVIFKFAYGKQKMNRSQILYFAHPIADALKLKCKYIPRFLETLTIPKALGFDKKWAVNFKNYHYLSSEEEVNNTIEIRVANGTLERITIQNTVNFYLKLMEYVMSDKYDEALINRLFMKLKPKEFDQYQHIYIKDALILIDLIFDDSLDKINFLKQYVKDEPVLVRK